jgi:hypothetical protein
VGSVVVDHGKTEQGFSVWRPASAVAGKTAFPSRCSALGWNVGDRMSGATTPEWRWIDQRGTVNAVNEAELKELLSSGAASPQALVWRPGWAEWLPARRIPQFAAALGPHAGPPQLPVIDARIQEPPSPPKRGARRSIRPSTSQPVSWPRMRPKAAGESTGVGRRPMPTIDEEVYSPLGGTLRPPAAVPPPPRAMPPADLGPPPVSDTEGVRLLTPVAELLSTGDQYPENAVELERRPQVTAGRPEERSRPTSAPSPDWITQLSPASLRRWLIALLASSLFTGLLAVAAIVLVLTRGWSQPAPLPAMVSAPMPSAAPRAPAVIPPQGCHLFRPAQRLASNLEASVPVLLARVPGGKSVAVGFAQGATQTGALTVDLASFQVVSRPNQPSKGRIVGVVPLMRAGELEFAVDVAGSPLQSPRTLAPELTVGFARKALARLLDGKKTRELWPLDAEGGITTPQAALVHNRGYALTFRSGGQSGKIRVAWLGPDGEPSSDLGAIQQPGLVGTPTVGENDERVLVAFAARSSHDEAWSIRLATARFGEPPSRAHAFVLPPGGAGGEAISPSATGLPGGQWLLVWTEGAAGNRQVRAQRLDAELSPVGVALSVSPGELNAGQGAALGMGPSLLAVFVTVVDQTRELWGATVGCPS